MAYYTIGGDPVEDLVSFVREQTRNSQTVHVGTDSLQDGRYTRFVTVVAIHNVPKGGRVIYEQEVVPRITSLRERLTKEVWRSLEVAMLLQGKLNTLPIVHLDVNPNERWASSKYLNELVGLVASQGFPALYKPHSWASTHAADHIVRLRNLRRREHTRATNKTHRGRHA